MGREGFDIGERRFRRMYRAQNQQVRARRKRHVQYVHGTARLATTPNQCWSLDFLHDILLNRRKFRVLDIIDDFTRINLQLDIDFSFPSRQVTRIFDDIAQDCGGSRRPARRSGARTYSARNAAMGGRAQRSFTIHRTREADAQRLHQKLKRSSPRQIPQSPLFSKPVRSSRRCPRLVRRLQQRSPARRAQRYDADRVRQSIQPTPTVLSNLNSDPTLL